MKTNNNSRKKSHINNRKYEKNIRIGNTTIVYMKYSIKIRSFRIECIHRYTKVQFKIILCKIMNNMGINQNLFIDLIYCVIA